MPRDISSASAAGLALAGALVVVPMVGGLAERHASQARAGSNEESVMKSQTSKSEGRSVQVRASASAHASSSLKAQGSGTRCASESTATVDLDGSTRRVVHESHQATDDGACRSSARASVESGSGDVTRSGLDGAGAASSVESDRSPAEASD